MIEEKIDLSPLKEGWPSKYVARCAIAEFTGGAMTPKRMANLDSLGEGPEGAFHCGRKVLYPIHSLIAWLEKRSQIRMHRSTKKMLHSKQPKTKPAY